MSNVKQDNINVAQPDTSKVNYVPVDSLPGHKPGQSTATSNGTQDGAPRSSMNNKRNSILGRAFSKANKDSAKQFFSAYAQTWIGLSPIWLMGEAVTGKKVGTQFKRGASNLRGAAADLATALATSSQDIIIIVDEKLRDGKDGKERGKTAEVLKAAGENAILVVTTSLEKAQEQLKKNDIGAQVQKIVRTNGRDVVVLLDKTLRNPIVITGVSRFARSKGIPHAEALLRLASLGLAKILREFPEENLEGVRKVEEKVEELDAEMLERSSTQEEREQANRVGNDGKGDVPKMKTHAGTAAPTDPYDKMKKDTTCVLM